ncbi:MAG: PLP-dependent aspartate aminotransferase family protein [Nocardioidaceae bacterium]
MAPHAPDTRAVHAGRDDLTALGVHVPPIDLSTTYPMPSVEAGGAAYDKMGAGNPPDAGDTLVYQRLWNPTVARFEQAVAELEGLPGAVAFATGMAALTAVLIATVADNKPHVVAIRPLYGGSDHLLATGLLGTKVSWVTPDEVADAVTPDTGLVIVETPANPTLQLVDLARLAADAGDVPLLVDNTFATPVLQQPARHGARMVLHSATKFLGGHGDLMGGIVAADDEWLHKIRPVRALTGALLYPLAGYQLHRGLQTLPVRVRAQQQTAAALASWLDGHPQIQRVYYPGLPGQDPQSLVGRQMAGPGSIVAFEPCGGGAAAEALVTRLRLITHAVSLGGVDTLIQDPHALTHRFVEDAARPNAAVLRISVGLEDLADLTADLDQALRG